MSAIIRHTVGAICAVVVLYADVISQVGGKYVQSSSIMSNPNTDPHTFEASPAVARAAWWVQMPGKRP